MFIVNTEGYTKQALMNFHKARCCWIENLNKNIVNLTVHILFVLKTFKNPQEFTNIIIE